MALIYLFFGERVSDIGQQIFNTERKAHARPLMPADFEACRRQ